MVLDSANDDDEAVAVAVAVIVIDLDTGLMNAALRLSVESRSRSGLNGDMVNNGNNGNNG